MLCPGISPSVTPAWWFRWGSPTQGTFTCTLNCATPIIPTGYCKCPTWQCFATYLSMCNLMSTNCSIFLTCYILNKLTHSNLKPQLSKVTLQKTRWHCILVTVTLPQSFHGMVPSAYRKLQMLIIMVIYHKELLLKVRSPRRFTASEDSTFESQAVPST